MEDTILAVAKFIDEKRFGKYRGFVTNNQDPEKRGRVKLTVPSVLGEQETDWALPCLPFGGQADYGFFSVPEVEAQVWVEFEEGDPSRPLWVGTFWQQESDVPQEAALETPTTRLLKTKSGHLLQFDDEPDLENITLRHMTNAELNINESGIVVLKDAAENKLTLDADAGEIIVEDSNGNKISMTSSGTTVEDANGNKIEMAAAGITVEGAQVVVKGDMVMLGGQGGEPVIKGQSFLTLFATHMHPTTAPGAPTGPPVPQGEMSSLSSKVMTS
jgi:uncharacterized protein involved in type VI secretion and phage assembly